MIPLVLSVRTIAAVFILVMLAIPTLPKVLAQATINETSITMPTPQIIHPISGSNLAGTVAVEIYIDPTVVWQMNVYAYNSSATRLFLGVANQESGPYFLYYWNTATVSNGPYELQAEAQITSGDLRTYSQRVPVYVANSSGGGPKPTPTPTPTTTLTPDALQSSPTPEPTATSSEGTVTAPDGETTQSSVIDNLIPVAAATPNTSIPVSPAPSVLPTPKDIVNGSRILATLNFTQDQGKENRLDKIESRVTSDNQKFLLFSGHARGDSLVKITVNSQPLVMSTKADSSGNWTYVLENPLEPGKHEVYIEVSKDNYSDKSGPYLLGISRAQASPENPTGASLDLFDPSTQELKKYLITVGGAIALATIVIFLVFLRWKKKNTTLYTAPKEQ